MHAVSCNVDLLTVYPVASLLLALVNVFIAPCYSSVGFCLMLRLCELFAYFICMCYGLLVNMVRLSVVKLTTSVCAVGR